MTENEMKEIISHFIQQSLRKVVLPATLGLGLALTTGCGNDDGEGVKDLASHVDGQVVVEYMAPFSDQGLLVKDMGGISDTSTDIKQDLGASPKEDTNMVARYMAPLYDQGGSPKEEASIGVKYMAVHPDTGLVTKYMGPFPQNDLGNTMGRYGAPFIDQGVVVKYMACF